MRRGRLHSKKNLTWSLPNKMLSLKIFKEHLPDQPKIKKKNWPGVPLQKAFWQFLNHLPQLTSTRPSLLSEIQTTKETVKYIFHS